MPPTPAALLHVQGCCRSNHHAMGTPLEPGQGGSDKGEPTGCAAVASSSACTCASASPSFTGLAASIAPPSPTRTYTSPAAPAATASPEEAHLDLFLDMHDYKVPFWQARAAAGGAQANSRVSWAVLSPEMSPLGFRRELETRCPSGTRIAFTIPPPSSAAANTLRSAGAFPGPSPCVQQPGTACTKKSLTHCIAGAHSAFDGRLHW